MRRTPLVALELGIALALGPAAAHAGPMDNAPGEGKDLYKKDVRGQRLAGADFGDAYLAGANFNGVSLGKAKMKWVIAFNATCVKARMQRVTMTNSVLDGSDFTSADLRRARFQDSTGEFPTISRANLTSANPSNVYFLGPEMEGAKLVKANLTGAKFGEAQLMGADLTGADLTGADLTNADLRFADLRYADLTGATLNGAKLTGEKLLNATINGLTCAADSVGACR